MATGASVLIKDKNSVTMLVDTLSGGAHIANITQQLIHAGELFAVSLVTKNLMNNSSIEILLRTATKPTHASLRLTATGTADLAVFEAPTTTADGSALTVINRNRVIGGVGDILLFSGPTVTVDGVKLLDEIVPTAGRREVSELLADELVCRANTDYLLRISNTSGGNINVGTVIDFFEEP